VYFSIFLADPNTQFASLKLSPEGGGELLFGNGAHHPFPGVLEALLGKVEVSQPLHLLKLEEVPQCKVR
jgi:hypothetical protein